MAFKHIGFNYKEFSRKSKKIIIDIEEHELLKKTIDIDIPICADISKLIKEFMITIYVFVKKMNGWIIVKI